MKNKSNQFLFRLHLFSPPLSSGAYLLFQRADARLPRTRVFSDNRLADQFLQPIYFRLVVRSGPGENRLMA